MVSVALYTPEVLGLATSLAEYPWDEALTLKGEARSKSCGSTISLGLATDSECRVVRVGVRSQACAIGQAAAAIFAKAVPGLLPDEILDSERAIRAWLEGNGPMPYWPGLEAIAPAQAYPARHGAILLAWQAARDILPST